MILLILTIIVILVILVILTLWVLDLGSESNSYCICVNILVWASVLRAARF